MLDNNKVFERGETTTMKNSVERQQSIQKLILEKYAIWAIAFFVEFLEVVFKNYRLRSEKENIWVLLSQTPDRNNKKDGISNKRNIIKNKEKIWI